MKTVRYEAAADEELIDEIVRYELRRDGLGSEFLSAVRDAVRLITENPGAWQASEHGRDVRRFVMDRFPFTIVYTELTDEILIIAIAHASREPGYWRTRQ
ncbi:MAG: type II toxin-antitoxin system RelE/ParE family toxin [Kofleriaceae bacterium]|nr:type II toxin-antitoxin system RelE/ParE family toxin [Kofleriaceae bacterium]